jgi:hypothetical protein
MASETVPEFVALTLSNAGEGKLEAQFQEAIAQAYQVFAESAEPGRFELGVDASLKCTVGLEVSLVLDLESRTLSVDSRVAKFTPPKRKKISRSGFMRSGAVLVERLTQADLPMPAAVRAINDQGD